jgi:flagellar export protein FliJ
MARRPSVHYDTMLRIRKRQEDLRARALAAAHQEVLRAERELASIEAKQRETLQEAGKRATKHFDARDIRLYYQYERHLARLADEKSAEIIELRAQEQKRRTELEDAMKQRRVMEKLIERKRRTYFQEVRKEEQAFADETAANYAVIARAAARRKKSAGVILMPEPPEPNMEMVL